MPPDAMVKLGRVGLRAESWRPAGLPRRLFDDSDGTAKREAYRQWTLGRRAAISGGSLAVELTDKLGSPVALKFDNYGTDMVSRAQVFSKLIAADGMTNDMALAIAGLMTEETADAVVIQFWPMRRQDRLHRR